MTVRRSREVTLRSDTADAPRRVMRGFSYSSHSVSEVACRGWWVGWDGTYVLRGGRCGDSRRVGPNVEAGGRTQTQENRVAMKDSFDSQGLVQQPRQAPPVRSTRVV